MRAQTTLDFAIGIVIFLAVVLFVFSFVPGILEPFAVGGEEKPSQSDRIADALAQERFGSATEPYALDRFCTVAFFDGDRTDPPDECNYGALSLDEEFDLARYENANLTITGNINRTSGGSSLLCWTDSSDAGVPANEPGLDELAECDTNSDIVLASGDEPPASGATTITARRVVSLHDQSVTIRVVVW